MNNRYLAFDLGASSGRAITGTFNGETLEAEEIHRFETGMVRINNSWHWNIFTFFEEMKIALKKQNELNKIGLKSLAVDTWGVDFGLLTRADEFLGLPYAYRDPRTDGIPEAFFEIMDKKTLYELTGIEMMQFNSLFQLYAMVKNRSLLLDAASSLLFIPDLFNFLFTGKKATEFSFATTSQLFNPKKNRWEEKIFNVMGLSSALMNDIVLPGTELGTLTDPVKKQTGSGDIRVVSTVSHDTGAAVACIPAKGKNWAYISSGTWSLMGIESEVPVITDEAHRLCFSNEGGINGTYCLQKNITGLWILQQFKESSRELADYDYERLVGKAQNAPAFLAVIDPDDPRFINPDNMKNAICEYLEATGQKVPQAPSHIVRIILESLALKYRYTLDQLRQVSRRPIETIHIIGGGAKNYLLNRFTANATGLPVIAGPYEGTAMGNLLAQAMADDAVTNIEQGRQIIKNSVKLKTFLPENTRLWELAYEKYREIVNRK